MLSIDRGRFPGFCPVRRLSRGASPWWRRAIRSGSADMQWARRAAAYLMRRKTIMRCLSEKRSACLSACIRSVQRAPGSARMNSAQGCLRAAMVAACVMLAGCASSAPRSQPALSMTIRASSTLNPDADGRAAPVLVRIYELRAKDVFDRATFFELYDHDARLLDKALLQRTEIAVRPGETVPLVRPLDPATRAVAVIVAYERIDDAKWHASVALNSSNGAELTATLESSAVTLIDRTPAHAEPERGPLMRWIHPVWQAATSMFGRANERSAPNP